MSWYHVHPYSRLDILGAHFLGYSWLRGSAHEKMPKGLMEEIELETIEGELKVEIVTNGESASTTYYFYFYLYLFEDEDEDEEDDVSRL